MSFDLDTWLRAIDPRLVQLAAPGLRRECFDTLDALKTLRDEDNTALQIPRGLFRLLLSAVTALQVRPVFECGRVWVCVCFVMVPFCCRVGDMCGPTEACQGRVTSFLDRGDSRRDCCAISTCAGGCCSAVG